MAARALALLCLLAVLAPLTACGNEGDSVSSEDIVRDAEARNKREERLAKLERRLKRLKAQRGSAKRVETPSTGGGFERFAAGLNGTVGLTLGAPGSGEVVKLGNLEGGSAWSTIKVPIALRVLDGGGSAAQRTQVERAITASDNSAADSLFAGLGSPASAAASVTEVLRSAGDDSTQVSAVGRDGFSPYGQTDWPLESQHRFMAALAGGCVGEPNTREYVLGLMGRVTSDSWGLGSFGSRARWKGGWGPGTDGRYLARQMGVVDTGAGKLVVTLAVIPSDGSFASGQAMASKVAAWAVANGASAAGRASGC